MKSLPLLAIALCLLAAPAAAQDNGYDDPDCPNAYDVRCRDTFFDNGDKEKDDDTATPASNRPQSPKKSYGASDPNRPIHDSIRDQLTETDRDENRD